MSLIESFGERVDLTRATYYTHMHHIPHGRFVLFQIDGRSPSLALMVRVSDRNTEGSHLVILEGPGAGQCEQLGSYQNQPALDVTFAVTLRVKPRIGVNPEPNSLQAVALVPSGEETGKSFYLQLSAVRQGVGRVTLGFVNLVTKELKPGQSIAHGQTAPVGEVLAILKADA